MRQQMQSFDPTNPMGNNAPPVGYNGTKLNSTAREQYGQNDPALVNTPFNTMGGMNSNPTSGIQMNATQRDTTNVSYSGPAMSKDAKPMSYEDILKSEGLSLRSVTDENRMPSTLKLNEDPTRGRELTNVELKPNQIEHNRPLTNQRQNSVQDIDNLPREEFNPNRLEVVNDRVDTSITNQLNNNPYVIPMKLK